MKTPRIPDMLALAMAASLGVAILILPSASDAQALKRLRNAVGTIESKVQSKVGDAVEKAVEEKTEEKVDEILGRWFGTGGQTGSSGTSGSGAGGGATGGYGYGGGMGMRGFGMDMNATTESVYDFDYKISHYMESVDNGRTTRSRMVSYLNSEGSWSALEFQDLDAGGAGGSGGSSEAYMIIDMKNNAMVMLMDESGERSSIAFSMPPPQTDGLPEMQDGEEGAGMAGDDDADEPMDADLAAMFSAAYGYEEIGTRTISGYRAKGYRTGDASGDVEFWVTDEPIKGYKSMLSSSGTVPMMAIFAPYASMGGMVVEVVVNDRSSGSKTMMRVEDGSGPTSHRIRMADWPRAM